MLLARSSRWALANRHRQLGRRPATQHSQRHRAPDAITGQEIQQVFWRLDRLTIEVEDDVANQNAG